MGLFRHVSFCRTGWERCSFQLGSGVGSIGSAQYGLSPVICLLSASAGNLLGSLTCYAMGRMGRMDWLEKYFHMKREKVERMQAYLNGRSGFMAFFAFLPIIGSVIAVALGFLRSNIWVVSISMLAGKMLRYILVILAARGLIDLMV